MNENRVQKPKMSKALVRQGMALMTEVVGSEERISNCMNKEDEIDY